MDPLTLLRASDTELKVTSNVEKTKLELVVYLSDPTSDTTPEGLGVWAKEHGVTPAQVYHWKRSRDVKSMVLSNIRESVYNGEGMGLAYTQAIEMLSCHSTPRELKAQIITLLLRLDMKRVELATKLYSNSHKKRTVREIPVEDIIDGCEESGS